MKKIAPFVIVLALALSSCTKEGPAGPAGQDGNANVISSNTVTLSNWISLYDDGIDFTYSSTVTWSTITQDIRDRGMVMAYIKNPTTQAWQALPYSYSGDGYSEAFNFDINTGLVNITYDGYDLSGSPGASSLNGYITIRLVAVPASARTANPDVDWSNYQEVSALLDAKR
jgi:hypothetical protein